MFCRFFAIFSCVVCLAFAHGSSQVSAQTNAPVPANRLIVAQAPAQTAPTFEDFRRKVNENLVTIISGNPNGGFLYQAYDIAAAIGDGDNLRILPVVGRGGAHNVRDILYLRGIDMGITQANTLTYYDKNGELGPNIRGRIAYITRLFVDEMHILVRPEIKTLSDLNGKKVNFSNDGSGTQLTVRLVFDLLGIKAKEFNMGQSDAFEKMKTGELDASICVCGKPLRSFENINNELGFRLLPVPYTQVLENDYTPTTLTSSDYPNLIPEGSTVDTIGVSTVLATYNWPPTHPRYAHVAKFVEAFFSNFDRLKQPPRLEKWKSVNLAAELKNWKRFPPAAEWLAKNKPKVATVAQTGAVALDEQLARSQAEEAAPGDPEKQERLFQEFMVWVKRREAATGSQQ